MYRQGLALLLIAGLWVHLAGAQQLSITHFWISPSPSLEQGSIAPQKPDDVPRINIQPGGSGSFYIWARPEVNLNLVHWSLNVVSTNSEVIRLNQSHVTDYNPKLGTTVSNGVTKEVHRWEIIDEPAAVDLFTGASTPGLIQGILGYSVLGRGTSVGVGIGYDNANHYGDIEAFQGAWRLAKIDYEVGPNAVPDQTSSIFLQIGKQGLAHCGLQDTALCTSYSTEGSAAKFGAGMDKELLAAIDPQHPELSDRNKNSATADAVFLVRDTASGDFDGDGDADGRDFLTWQRNPSVGSLFDWQRDYGQSLIAGSLVVPEPPFLSVLPLVLIIAGASRSTAACDRHLQGRSPIMC